MNDTHEMLHLADRLEPGYAVTAEDINILRRFLGHVMVEVQAIQAELADLQAARASVATEEKRGEESTS